MRRLDIALVGGALCIWSVREDLNGVNSEYANSSRIDPARLGWSSAGWAYVSGESKRRTKYWKRKPAD